MPTDASERSQVRIPGWLGALVTAVSVLFGLVLLLLTPALNVYVACVRYSLRRAVRRRWAGQTRLILRDDDGAWGAALREAWLPRHGANTIVLGAIPPGSGDAADVELARRVYAEYGGYYKGMRAPVGVVVRADSRIVPRSLADALAAVSTGNHTLLVRHLEEL